MTRKPYKSIWLLLLLIFGTQAQEFQNVRTGANHRGGSFGLENFLMQPFDEDFNGDVNVEVKKEAPKKTQRGQTYGLESMTQDLSEDFQLNEDRDRRRPHHRVWEKKELEKQDLVPKWDETKPIERNKYSRPNGNVNDNSKRNELVTETIRKPLERPITFRKQDYSEKPSENDKTTARPRKRIAMRRRKRPLATPATENVETQTEDLVLGNEYISVPTTTTNAPVTTPFGPDSRPEQVHQSKRKRPMGFRVHVATTENEELKKKKEEEKQKIKEEKNYQEELDGDVRSGAGHDGDSAEVKSSNRLKLFLKRHQTGTVSLSELLQTQNLSLTDFLAGEKGNIAVPVVDDSTEPPRRNIKSRLDTVTPSSAASSISVKSRPFSKTENLERPNRYTKKNIVEGNENHVNSEIHENRNDKPEYNGFTPKNPRRFKKTERDEQEEEEKLTTTNDKKILEEKLSKTNHQDVTLKNVSSKSFWNTENRKLSELNYRRKLKIPKAETSEKTPAYSESTTNFPFFNDQQVSSSMVPFKSNEERKKLKTPFKSSNNPELALIFSNEKSKTYFNDRIGGMKFPGLNGGKEKEKEKESNKNEEKVLEEMAKINSENPIAQNAVSNNGTTLERNHGRKKEKAPESETDPVLEYESKDEILELLKSATTAQKLEKILASRNMTIGELLLNREKGSAQANFSRLFIESTKLPVSTRSTPTASNVNRREENEEKSTKNILYTLESEKREHFSDEMETDETSVFKNQVRILQNDGNDLDQRKDHSDRPSKKAETSYNGFVKRGEKTMDYNLFSTIITDEEPVAAIITPTAKPRTIDDYYRETKFAAKTLSSENAQDAFSLNQDVNKKAEIKETEVDKSFIPPVIKSTIIISGVVMGIALFVFIAIFAACGWRQRQLRLKADSSILNETLTAKPDSKKKNSSNRTLSPKRSNTYKKTLDFDDSRSVISVSSEASSYLWNTLKNTFTSRNNTLKNRLEKESCLKTRAGGITKKDNQRFNPEAKKYEERLNSLRRENEKYHSKKNYSEKDLIRTTDSFKRGVVITNQTNNSNSSNYHFDNWTQG